MTRSCTRSGASGKYAVMALSMTLIMYYLSSWLYLPGLGEHKVPVTHQILLIFMVFSAACSLVAFLVCTQRGSRVWRIVVFVVILTGPVLVFRLASNLQLSDSSQKSHPGLFASMMLIWSVVLAILMAIVSRTIFYEPAPTPNKTLPRPKSVPITHHHNWTLLKWVILGTCIVFAIRAKRRSST